jgi:hypothetical protein
MAMQHRMCLEDALMVMEQRFGALLTATRSAVVEADGALVFRDASLAVLARFGRQPRVMN